MAYQAHIAVGVVVAFLLRGNATTARLIRAEANFFGTGAIFIAAAHIRARQALLTLADITASVPGAEGIEAIDIRLAHKLGTRLATVVSGAGNEGKQEEEGEMEARGH
ncbi:MAG: hypothetical protein GY813_05720 [Halieaceae bacterium]|nr:hypothetical protein [Halieaceae bacterium]